MAILKTRFERATDIPLKANAFIRGGRLVTIALEGDHPHKPRVEETAGADDFAIGAAAYDALAEADVTVTCTRGLMLLTSAEAIPVDTDVYAASGGRVQALLGADTVPAGAKPFGRTFSSSDAADELLWVKPLQ